MSTSPFSEYRDMVLGHYGSAAWLRTVVMAMWNGQGYPAGLSQLTNLDDRHFEAFCAMAAHYRETGENDPAFMALAEEIQAWTAEEKAAQVRTDAMQQWQREMQEHSNLGGRAARYAMEDEYSWLEHQFDAGMAPADAMHALEKRIQEREGA